MAETTEIMSESKVPTEHRELLSRQHLSLKQVLESEAQAKLARAQIEAANAQLVRLGGPSVPCW